MELRYFLFFRSVFAALHETNSRNILLNIKLMLMICIVLYFTVLYCIVLYCIVCIVHKCYVYVDNPSFSDHLYR